MPRIRKFLVKDESRNDTIYGLLSYDTETKQFNMKINLGQEDYPPHFAIALQRGYQEFSSLIMDYWIKGRIIPPNRANIASILKGAGLKTYDEFGMLLYTNGRCCQDDLYLEEVDENYELTASSD